MQLNETFFIIFLLWKKYNWRKEIESAKKKRNVTLYLAVNDKKYISVDLDFKDTGMRRCTTNALNYKKLKTDIGQDLDIFNSRQIILSISTQPTLFT